MEEKSIQDARGMGSRRATDADVIHSKGCVEIHLIDAGFWVPGRGYCQPADWLKT